MTNKLIVLIALITIFTLTGCTVKDNIESAQNNAGEVKTEVKEKAKIDLPQLSFDIEKSFQADGDEEIEVDLNGDIGGSGEVYLNPKAEIDIKPFDSDNFQISDYENVFQKYMTSWYRRWAKHDIDFLDKFKKSSTGEISVIMEYDMKPYHLKNLQDQMYSPNGKYLLNVVYGGDPDTQVDLINLETSNVKNLLNCGTPCLYESGYWFDNDNFVVVASSEDFDGYESGIDYYDIPYEAIVYHYNLKDNTVTTYKGISLKSWDFFDMDEKFMKVNVFYGDQYNVKEYTKVVQKSPKIATETLKALFAGPYYDQGGSRTFSRKTKDILKEVVIKDEIAYVNLKEFRDVMPLRLAYDITAFFNQTNKTLVQYPGIKDVIYFIEGGDYNFYHWVSVKCPDDLCEYNPFQSDYIKLMKSTEEIYSGAKQSDALGYYFWFYGHDVSAKDLGNETYEMSYDFELNVNVPFSSEDIKEAYAITRYAEGDLPVIYEMVNKQNNNWYVEDKLHIVGYKQTFDIIFVLGNGEKYINSFKLKRLIYLP